MRDFMNSKLNLPNLKGIRIERIWDRDKGLVRFLSNCTPDRLGLLSINYYANGFTGIKSKFYISVFSKAVARISKEVFLFCINFSVEDLQIIVRAAHNAERIVFCFCCIHCSLDLDFGADLSYNTKFLSFQGWGSAGWDEGATDWKVEPSSFSLIVDAIGNSGLRTSLQKLNIVYNHSLSIFKVQEELNSKGMSHISVIEEWSSPLSS